MGPDGDQVACARVNEALRDRIDEGFRDRLDEGIHVPFRRRVASDKEWTPLFSGLTALHLGQSFSGTQHVSLHSA